MGYERVLLRIEVCELRLEVEADAAARHSLLQGGDEVPVGAGDDLIHPLDHGDLAAEGGVDGGHLQADDAAAEDEQALGDGGEGERAGGVEDARVIVRNEGETHGLRSGGDDGLVEGNRAGALGALHRDGVGRGELRARHGRR